MTDLVRVPKLTGADIELGNFIENAADPTTSARDAAQFLLAAIRARVGAYHPDVNGDKRTVDPQDRERTFLPASSGCAYIDLDHLELCLPETLSAWDHVAWWQAMLRIARVARSDVNALRSPDHRVQLLANNSDGAVSYGGHLNVLMSRRAWEDIAHRKSHHAAYLAAFQVSSLPITGQGKVGSDNGAPPVTYQLSQRADWFETVTGQQTTWMRPLVNTRDEALCGRWWERQSAYARLHCIFYDTLLCQTATLLRVGMMQLVLAMMEAGRVNVALTLDDPLAAVREWSHDPTLNARARRVDGREVTALEMQRRFWEDAARFVAEGGADGVVPRAAELVALWDDTLTRLEARDWPALARRLDWVLKLGCVERALSQTPALGWTSPQVKHLDQLYASLDESEGLHATFARAGVLDEVVPESAIAHAVVTPPRDTRAWARAQLHQCVGNALHHIDWDHIQVRVRDYHNVASIWRVDLADPLDNGAAQQGLYGDTELSMEELLYRLGATRENVAVAPTAAWTSRAWPTRHLTTAEVIERLINPTDRGPVPN